MKRGTALTINFAKVMCAMLVSFCILLTSFNALALNYDLVEDEFNGWVDIEPEAIDSDKITGTFKRIIDSDSGCVYIYFMINDKSMINMPVENAMIVFDIKNNINNYHFNINNNGFYSTGTSEQKAIKTAQNIKKSSSFITGFVGFELVNKTDKKLDSKIKCSYINGENEQVVLFDNAVLNMYAEATTRSKSNKQKTTKSGNKTSKSTNTKTSKASKPDNEKSTKFEGEHKYTTKKQSSSAKSTTEKATLFDATKNMTANKNHSNAAIINNTENTQEYRSSDLARSIKVISIITAVAGIGLIGYGLALSKIKKSDKNENEQ